MTDLDRRSTGLAISLSLLAGFVDAIGFLVTGGFFVSFMTGNSTRVGVGIGELDFRVAGLGLGVILCFVTGVAIGTVIASLSNRPLFVLDSPNHRDWPKSISPNPYRSSNFIFNNASRGLRRLWRGT